MSEESPPQDSESNSKLIAALRKVQASYLVAQEAYNGAFGMHYALIDNAVSAMKTLQQETLALEPKLLSVMQAPMSVSTITPLANELSNNNIRLWKELSNVIEGDMYRLINEATTDEIKDYAKNIASYNEQHIQLIHVAYDKFTKKFMEQKFDAPYLKDQQAAIGIRLKAFTRSLSELQTALEDLQGTLKDMGWQPSPARFSKGGSAADKSGGGAMMV